jgi:ech hydrogenase subunit F
MDFFNLGGMTLRSLFGKPETVCYPTQVPERPAGSKGRVQIDVSKCVLCGLCAKRCPAEAIEVNRAAATWSINRFACVQCGSCVRGCPKGSLSMDVGRPRVSAQIAPDVIDVPSQKKAS